MAAVGTLEEQALQRKAKLKALRSKKSEQQSEGQPPEETSKPKLKFRSYNPQTEELKEKKLPKGRPENVDSQIQEQLDAAKDSDLGEVNLTNLAPKKVDWDLKRDIARKLEKLERKTQKAIVELICERLQGEAEDGALASAVAATGTSRETGDSD